MKRFLLFAGSHYYPGGGLHDLIGDYDRLDEAVEKLESLAKDQSPLHDLDWAHVLDTHTRTIVLNVEVEDGTITPGTDNIWAQKHWNQVGILTSSHTPQTPKSQSRDPELT